MSSSVKPVSYTHLDVYKRQSLHCALTIGIIPIVAHKTILIDCQQAVLLVPLELLLTCLVILFAITLYTRGVDVDKIAVRCV